MRRINIVLVFAVLAGLLVFPAQRAHACSCVQTDYSSVKYLDTLDAVFVGRVIQVQENRMPIADAIPNDKLVTFFVNKGFKGIDGAVIEVATNFSSASCGLEFEVGREYVVFATKHADVLLTSVCNGTQPAEQAGDLLVQLREYAPLPNAPQASFAVSIPVRRNEVWNCRRNFVCTVSFRGACENLRLLPGLVVFCR